MNGATLVLFAILFGPLQTLPETTPPPISECVLLAFHEDACRQLTKPGLPDWQRVALTNALSYPQAVKVRRAFITYYCPPAFKRGAGCRWWGRASKRDRTKGCSERVVGANLLTPYSFVWVGTSKPNGTVQGEIRQVLDTGADYNDRIAETKGADLWLDYWVPTAKQGRRYEGVKYVISIPRRPRPWEEL